MDPLTNPLRRLAPVQEPDPTTPAPAQAPGEDGFVDPQSFFTPDRRQQAYPNPLNPPDPDGFQDPTEFYKPPDKGFVDALKETGWSEVPFVGQVVDGARMVKLWDAAKAMEAGNPTEDQLKLVAEFLEEGRRDGSVGYTVGKILTALPAYAIEFIAGGEVATRIGTTGAVRGLGLAIQQALRKTAFDVGGVAARRLTSMAVRGAEIAAKSAVQTATMPGRILDAGIQRALSDKLGITGDREQLVIQGSLPNLVETLPRGALDMWIENVSEHSGGMVPPEASLNQLAAKLIDRFVQTVPNATVEKTLEKIASKTGWHGVLSEWGEERFGAALRSILLGDPWSDVIPSAKQGAAEAIAFAVPGAAGAIASRVLPEPPATETTKLEPGQSLNQGPPIMTSPGEAGASAPLGGSSPASSGDQPSTPAGWDEVGPAEEEAAKAPHVESDITGVDEEAQRAAATLVHANARAAGSEVDPKGARIVEPRGPIQEWARDFLQQRGIPTAFVDVGGRQLQLGAVFNGYAIALDANTGADNTLRATVFHETAHAVRRGRRQSWGRFYADVRAADPEGLDLAEAEYASDIKTTLGKTLDSEQTQNEGLSRYIESMAGYVELAFRDPQRLVRLATKNPGLFQSILDAVITTVNRMIGTNLPTAIERQLKKFQAEAKALTPNVGIRKSSDRATEMDPQRAAQIALKLRRLLNETVGMKAESRADATIREAPAPARTPEVAPASEGAPNAEPGEPTVPSAAEREQDSAGVVGSPPAESIAQPTKGRLVPTRGPNGEVVWKGEPAQQEPAAQGRVEQPAQPAQESTRDAGQNDDAGSAASPAPEPAGASAPGGEAGQHAGGDRGGGGRGVRDDDVGREAPRAASEDVPAEGATPERGRVDRARDDDEARGRDAGSAGEDLDALVAAEIERQLAAAEPEPEPVRQKPLPPPDAAAVVGKPKRLRAKKPAEHPRPPPALEAKKPEVLSPFVKREPIEQPVRDEEWMRKAAMFVTNIRVYSLRAEDFRKEGKTQSYLGWVDRAAASAWDLYQHLGITEVSESDDPHLLEAQRQLAKYDLKIQSLVDQWRNHLERIKALQPKLDEIKNPPPAPKSDLDRALDQLRDEFNIAPTVLDEAKYSRVRGAFDVVAGQLGSEADDTPALVRALVSFLIAQKLPPEKVRAMQPYLVRYAGERIAARKPIEAAQAASPEGPHLGNYRITADDETRIGHGSDKERARRNLEAIRILKSGKAPTVDEKRTLVTYQGWGASGLANTMFPNPRTGAFRKGWEDLGRQLAELVTPDEYKAMRASTTNAHYTSLGVVRAMWTALQHFGFNGGSVLEPGLGVGHFIGAMPEDLAERTAYSGVELDPVTAGIASMLYPKASVQAKGFEGFEAPRDSFDAAIGNPPFAKVTILSDNEYRKHRLTLHDYFFVKTLDRVKPGGIVLFVTSRYTMDKQDARIRKLMDERAEFVGAVRLPQTAFKENAGTEVVTDIIVLRRKRLGVPSVGVPWTNTVALEHDTQINEYFLANPQQVIGRHSFAGSMYKANEYTVELTEEQKAANFDALVREALLRLPANIAATGINAVESMGSQRTALAEGVSDRSFHLVDDKLYQRRYGVDVPVDEIAEGERPSKAHEEIIRSYVPLRDAVLDVFRAQTESKPRMTFEDALANLDKAYDAFVSKHGPVNHMTVTETKRLNKKGVPISIVRRPNMRALWEDPDIYRVAAIEDYDEEKRVASKSRFFRERTVAVDAVPKIETASDALNVSMNELGKVDVAHVAKLLGQSVDDTIKQLGPALYFDPELGRFEVADKYLSGNVRQKLVQAKAAAELDPTLGRNVEALERVQPKDLTPAQIKVQFGAAWLNPQDVEAWAKELGIASRVRRYEGANQWSVESANEYGVDETVTYGTQRYPASKLLLDLLRGQSIRVTDSIRVAGKRPSQVINQEETQAALEKADKLLSSFTKWLWEEPERSARILNHYNWTLNAVVARKYDGSHLTLPGLSRFFKLRQHQLDVVWRIIQSGNTYMAHGVGAGKTLAMATAAMEMRRLGLARKPLFVVPNHMLAQFARETLQAYPNANIYVADEQQFHKDRRKQFVARVAAGNWDAVFMTYSAFKRVRAPSAEIQSFLNEQLDTIVAALAQARGNKDRGAIKDLERRRKQLEERMKRDLAQDRKDAGIEFHEMGVDMMFVDEAHTFRKLDFYTTRGRIKGITPEGSDASLDFYVKSRMLDRKNPGRSIVLASGTPITNTIGELFTVQRFLQPEALKAQGIDSFDAWAATFGQIITSFELTDTGKYKSIERFAGFSNMPELQRMVREVMDFVNVKDLTYIRRPTLHNVNVGVPATPELRTAMQAFNAALEAAKGPDKGKTALRVVGDARYLAMHPEFMLRSLGRPASTRASGETKLDRAVAEIARIYKEGTGVELLDTKLDPPQKIKANLTQMVFCDLGVNPNRGFTVQSYLRRGLTQAGVPDAEIAFIGDYPKPQQKLELFRAMNTGKVRVLIGSTSKMGTGVNAQRLLKAMHHLSVPWYPADLEQRVGRMWRQGNLNADVVNGLYSTEWSNDASMWQRVQTKQLFIEQFLKGDLEQREIEDLDGDSNVYAQAKAAATGDPRVLRLVQLEHQAMKLGALERAHRERESGMASRITHTKIANDRRREEIDDFNAWQKRIGEVTFETFSAEIEGKTVTGGKDGQAALDVALAKLAVEYERELLTNPSPTVEMQIGSVGGCPLWAKQQRAVGWGDEDTRVTLWFTTPDVTGVRKGVTWIKRGTHLKYVRTGTWRGIFNTVEDITAHVESLKKEIAKDTIEIEKLKSQQGQAFEQTALLESTLTELSSLRADLAATKKQQAAESAAAIVEDGESADEGDIVDDAEEDDAADDEDEFAINAWHGSPHQFDRFDHSHMGRGEGNQSFGWGTYLADERGLAEYYRLRTVRNHIWRRLREEGVGAPDESMEEQVAGIMAMKWSDKELRFWKALQQNDWLGFDTPVQAAMAMLDKDGGKNFDPDRELWDAVASLGTLYRVNAAVEREHLLDLDLTMRNQPRAVWDAVNEMSEEAVLAKGFNPVVARTVARLTGVEGLDLMLARQFYFTLEASIGGKTAAEVMRRFGIMGNVYLDARSRKEGVGSSNYVIFDDEVLSIEEQFAIGPRITAAVAKRIRAFAGKAQAEGETTTVGTKPNPVAMTDADPAVRAFSRGVYEERASTADAARQAQAQVRLEAEAAYDQDPDGTRRRILRTIDRGGTLDAWDMVTAQRFATDDAIAALTTGDPRAYRDAAKVLWMYRNAGRDTARSLAIRRGVPARTAKEQLAEIITTPERKIREELDDLEDKRRAPGVTDEEIDRLTEEIGKRLEAQAKLWAKAADKLRKMGIDPQLVTEDYYEDLVTLGRLIRTARAGASSKWDWFIEYRLSSMLSGPATQVANITGNAGNLVLHQGMYRLAETLTNTVLGSKDAPTWSETLHFMRSWLPEVLKSFSVLARAFVAELPVFEMDLKKRGALVGLIGSKVDALHGPAIPGVLGRIIRAPSLTALLAFDEFFKSIVATTEAHALAFRLAKNEGLKGEAMEKRIREVLDDGAHPVHLQGLLQARNVTFQNEGGELVQAGLGVRRALNHMFGGVPVGSMLLPFIQTPGAIFKAGLSVPFYPLIAVRNVVSGNWRGNRAAANQDIARSLVAFATVVGVWAMVGGAGGDDDDKDLPLVTGSSPRGRGARDLANRTVPPYSMRVGDAWFSYRRLDPASVSLASLVDMINTLNGYEQGGDQASFTDALGRVLTSVADQAADKTYLQTLGDLYRIVVTNDAGKAALPRLVRDTLVLPLIPNIVRQPSLKLDDDVRVSQDRKYEDMGVWEASARALPHLAAVPGVPPPPPRYDVWGRQVKRADSTSPSFWRLVSPWPKAQERPNVDPLDLWIVEYNRRVDAGQFGEDAKPLYPAPVPYWYRDRGKVLYWSDDEYEILQREAGRRAHERLSSLGLDPENPKERDRKRIEDALADARRFVRNRLLRERRAGVRSTPP